MQIHQASRLAGWLAEMSLAESSERAQRETNEQTDESTREHEMMIMCALVLLAPPPEVEPASRLAKRAASKARQIFQLPGGPRPMLASGRPAVRPFFRS